MTRKRLSWDARHQQLIGAALDFVRAGGADALTLAKVAETAGVSKPVVYEHFFSREGLLVELFKAFDDFQQEELRQIITLPDTDLVTLARSVARAYLQCYADSQGVFLAIYSVMRSSPDLTAKYDKLVQDNVNALVSLFRDKSPLDDEALGLACACLIGAADTVASWAALGNTTKDKAETSLTNMILSFIGGRQPAALLLEHT